VHNLALEREQNRETLLRVNAVLNDRARKLMDEAYTPSEVWKYPPLRRKRF